MHLVPKHKINILLAYTNNYLPPSLAFPLSLSFSLSLSLNAAKLVVMTLPRSSPGSGPVVVETERGGVVESSLTFSYVPVDDNTGGGGGGGGGVMGGASRPSLVNLGGMLESPLLSNKKAKQSGESASYSGT